MKRFLLAAVLVFATVAAFSQDDEYQKFLEQRKKQMKEKSEANQKKMLETEYGRSTENIFEFQSIRDFLNTLTIGG